MRPPSPSRLMWLLFSGFALSFGYVLLGSLTVWLLDGTEPARQFFVLYSRDFRILVSLGLIAGTALIVGYAQHVIPKTIEGAFSGAQLRETRYFENKQKFYSLKRTLLFASEFVIIGFLILYFCDFPAEGLPETLLMLAGCTQWALASYVGRKLRYAGMMMYSLLDVEVTVNLFKERALDVINNAVHIASTLTIVFIYLHIRGYYNGPFNYERAIGDSAQVFLLLPAILATPVLLIFNFFPREVLRRIYNRSIDVEVHGLKKFLKKENLGPFEKKLRLLELTKMYREELRYSLQLTLSDLPIGITVIVMLAEPFLDR